METHQENHLVNLFNKIQLKTLKSFVIIAKIQVRTNVIQPIKIKSEGLKTPVRMMIDINY